MSAEITPLLIQQIRLRQAHLRSIQVEQDLYNPQIYAGYVLTPQVLSAIGRITTPTSNGKPPRAWTITGPYGAGKSYFAIYLMNLANTNLPAHAESAAALQGADPLLAESAHAAFATQQTRGLLTIAVTGFRAPLQICLQKGCLHTLESLPPTAARQTLMNTITQWDETTRSRTIIEDLTTLTTALQTPQIGYAGLLILLDELGKPLEYAAAHPEQADIYLLQELAEFASRSTAPVYLIGILHQAFEGYAALLDSGAQREWQKIQGRFEDLVFQEPPAQQIRLTASAIEHNLLLSNTELGIEQPQSLSAWCPPFITIDELQNLARRAYPLHITSLVALPYLFRRLAQNERSLFAFLIANEPSGFQEFLANHTAPSTLRLHHLFEYLIANFQARLYATNRSRTLTETIERLETAVLNPLERRVLQTVGLLHWLSESTPLTATRENLLTALQSAQDTPTEIIGTLQSLQKRSLLVYRRFNHTYAIWQGSDIDLEAELRQAEHRLSAAFSLADVVQHYLPPRPLVAQRHSYKTGTLRYFEMRFVDAGQPAAFPAEPQLPGASGLILIALPMHPKEAADFENWAQQPEQTQRADRIFGIVTRTARLIDLARELRQLHWVRENTPALRDDPVARRELRARLHSIEQLIQQELEKHLSLHRIGAAHGCLWFYQGKQQTAQRALSSILSNACDTLYPKSPKIWNEMLNRRELSSQAAGARRNLIQAMLHNPSQPTLGIQGFAPERSMYETLLYKGGLHQPTQDGETWHFCKPLDKAPDRLNLLPIWEFLEEQIFLAPMSPRPLLHLFSQLSAPPYGVTAGVLPVLLCAFMQVHQHEITLYRENTLLPEPAAPDWEVLLRRPDLFAIAGCRLEGAFENILKRFASAFGVQPAAMPVVRSLIRRLKTLPDYTWRTRSVSAYALQLRSAVETAYSPEKFLFADLPTTLGLTAFTEQDPDEDQVNQFFRRLNLVLTELNDALPKIRNIARDQLLATCNWQTGELGWRQFVGLASELQFQVTHPQLLPLLKRAAMTGDETVILESVLAYVAERPIHAWTDADAARFPAQADAIGKVFQTELQRRNLQIALTPQQQHTAQKVSAQLRPVLQQAAHDPIVLKAALQQLLDELSN